MPLRLAPAYLMPPSFAFALVSSPPPCVLLCALLLPSSTHGFCRPGVASGACAPGVRSSGAVARAASLFP
eukprot:1757442-Alexandrium_andersonii.AAC.1